MLVQTSVGGQMSGIAPACDSCLVLCVQVSPAERQLVTELLSLYTPDAVAGQAKLAKGRRVASPAAEQVLLDVLGLDGGHERASGHSIIRLAALTQLAGLYTSLTPDNQHKLLQVLTRNRTTFTPGVTH